MRFVHILAEHPGNEDIHQVPLVGRIEQRNMDHQPDLRFGVNLLDHLVSGSMGKQHVPVGLCSFLGIDIRRRELPREIPEHRIYGGLVDRAPELDLRSQLLNDLLREPGEGLRASRPG